MTEDPNEPLAHAFEERTAEATALFAQHAGAPLTLRPSPGAWSAAECVEHLNITTAATLPALRTAIAVIARNGRRRETRSRSDVMGALLVWSLAPPPRFPTKTPAHFEPVTRREPEAILAEFASGNAELAAALRGARGLDLSALKIQSVFNQRIRYNVIAAFRILESHERRHLWQASAAAGWDPAGAQ